MSAAGAAEGGGARSPAVWIDANGLACISPLAFNMADDATREFLVEHAAELQRQHATRATASVADTTIERARPAPSTVDKLEAATTELIAAQLALVQKLGAFRDVVASTLLREAPDDTAQA